MNKSVGLFGGTFDPVHNGHLSIAQSFLESDFVDELWILLTPYPPHKQEDEQSDYEVRLSMLRAAFDEMPGVRISTIENELPKPSYTFQSIRYFKNKHPGITFYFCMGEDSLSQFHTWKNHQKITQECELLVARRPGATHQEVDKEILDQVRFVEHTPLDISSSAIRERIQKGETPESELPEKVLAIIKKNQLYST